MQLSTTIPLFPLGLVLLPQNPLPLHIFEERYKLMIGECLAENRDFGIVFFDAADIRTVGCTARILKVLKRYHDGRLDILTRGQNRFRIKELREEKAYLEARVTFFDCRLRRIQPRRKTKISRNDLHRRAPQKKRGIS